MTWYGTAKSLSAILHCLTINRCCKENRLRYRYVLCKTASRHFYRSTDAPSISTYYQLLVLFEWFNNLLCSFWLHMPFCQFTFSFYVKMLWCQHFVFLIRSPRQWCEHRSSACGIYPSVLHWFYVPILKLVVSFKLPEISRKLVQPVSLFHGLFIPI